MLNRQITILLVLIIMLGASGYWLVWPAWNNIEQDKTDLADWIAKVEDAKQTEAKILSLAEKYNNSETTGRLLSALPLEEDKPGLIVQLENLAMTNGFILNSVEFLKEDQAGKISVSLNSQPKSVSDYKIISLAIELSGDAKSLNGFLEAVENNLRIMDVRSISFKIASLGEGVEQGNNFLISLNAYYREN